MHMILIRNLRHTYPGTRRQSARNALRDLSLEIPAGQFCILSGPNGSGKSTLFRILCGLAAPSSGSVSIGGHDLATAPERIRPLMGVVFQSPAVDKNLSVQENLTLHADLHGLRGTAAGRMTEALAWSDLKDRLGDRVETLSGGLARQVELAKCLMTRPQILLLDEPTTGLDPASRRSFILALRRLQRDRKMTVLMTSHVFSDAEFADSVAILRDGALMAHDTPDRLKAMVGTEMVVIRPRDPAAFATVLETGFSRRPVRYGDELRIENIPPAEAVPLIAAVLDHHRADVLSIGVKQPDLEDVFVHVTGRGAAFAADAEPSDSRARQPELTA
ncbi:ABC transporter ATP-binding protein [Novispirillum itersonii subsp. nipponicum]